MAKTLHFPFQSFSSRFQPGIDSRPAELIYFGAAEYIWRRWPMWRNWQTLLDSKFGFWTFFPLSLVT